VPYTSVGYRTALRPLAYTAYAYSPSVRRVWVYSR